MKKTIGLLLALILIIGLLPVQGFASDRDFSINSDYRFENGHTTITWNDSANAGPYIVAYMCNDDVEANQAVLVPGGTLEKATTYDKSFVIDELIPGHRYIVGVIDKNQEETILEITMPNAQIFEDGKLKTNSIWVTTEPRRYNIESGSVQVIDHLIASEITKNIDTWLYGLYYEIKLAELAYDRDYFVQVVITAPNGYCETVNSTQNIFGTGAGWTHYFRIMGISFFYNMLRNNDSIPDGNYKIELFFNGMLANTKEFKVKK